MSAVKKGDAIEVLTNERGWRPAVVYETYVDGFWVTYEGGRANFFEWDEASLWRTPGETKP